MGEGMGGVVMVMVVICLLVVALQCDADIHVVGDSNGWNMNISGWGSSKRFRTNDTILFYYPKGKHNVVRVTKVQYDGCFISKRDRVYTSGNDYLTVMRGANYFICAFLGHCPSMRIEIHTAD
ncbi:hypothetical protein M8C21_006097 [Ambrosia artemisiifolia]|uniref:Phytocyanin domain-containing protein n=1 Tax=Ambrosia artemisiifolia TaxID=4212 RepID=A0AAD5BQK3_AMBAR|nr:hypothetical protein M8C21_006097 [Ambrosia artemisiifolia]